MTLSIQEIPFASAEYKQLLELRYDILRKPLGLEVSAQDVATDNREFHIAAFENGKAVGCVLLRPITADVIKLRQMAVANEAQGQGLGKRLVKYAEELASARGFKIIETHARKVAQVFYEKLGYVAEGDYFTEVTIQTIKMHKTL